MWPDEAHTGNFYRTDRGLKITPMARFLLGQNHAMQHLGQIMEILRQAKAAKATA